MTNKFVTAQEAIEIFDRLYEMDLPHAYAEDGCYARAHLMCRFLEKRGHDVLKAWLIEDCAKSMRPSLPEYGKDPPYWRHHVMPALYVQGLDGGLRHMVFDTSFFDGPTEADEWAFVCDKDPLHPAFLGFRQPPDGYKGDYKINGSPEYTGSDTDQKALERCRKDALKLSGAPHVVYRSKLSQAMQLDGLTSRFTTQTNEARRVISPPNILYQRTKPYWEDVDPDNWDHVVE